LADIKIEIAKNAAGAPLKIETGSPATTWTTKPTGYQTFDKTVTGALSLPVDTKTYTGAGGTIYLKQTGNVVNLTIACNAYSGYSTGLITVAQITDVGCRPDSSINWTGRATSAVNAFFTLDVDGTVSYTCANGCNVEAKTYNITYVVNNVAAAHLVQDTLRYRFTVTQSSSISYNTALSTITINFPYTLTDTNYIANAQVNTTSNDGYMAGVVIKRITKNTGNIVVAVSNTSTQANFNYTITADIFTPENGAYVIKKTQRYEAAMPAINANQQNYITIAVDAGFIMNGYFINQTGAATGDWWVPVLMFRRENSTTIKVDAIMYGSGSFAAGRKLIITGELE
jgi:hypothetical protein